MNNTLKKELMNLLDECSLKEILLIKKIDFKSLYDLKKEKNSSRLIKRYIQNNEFEKAFEIGNKYLDNEIIQSQIIGILIKQKRYEEAFKIGQKFPNFELIQGQMVTILFREKRYKEAFKLGQRFPNNEIIQGKMIVVLLKQGRYKIALNIGKNFPNNEIIQSHMITMLINKKKYEDAIEIGKKFSNNEIIQSQLIKALIQQEKYEDAIEIGKKFWDNEIIQSQIIEILIKQEKYDEAIEIGKRFLNNVVVKSQMTLIQKEKKRKKEEIKYQIVDATIDYYELNVIRSKILLNTISQEDIKLLDKIKDEIGDNIYKLVLAAIYERLNLKNKAISILNEINNFDNKKINQLIVIIKSKKNKYYNIEKWDNIIGWPVDKDICIEQNLNNKLLENNDPEQNISNYFENTTTIYDSLNVKYKKMIFQLKLQYYREMYNVNTRENATKKYDKLEDILYQKASNQKAFLKLLLMLIESDFKEVIEYDYNDEFKILTEQIEKKKQQIKMLTKKG